MTRSTPQTAIAPPPPLSKALSFMQLLWAVAHGLESTSKRMHSRLGVTGPQRLVIRLVGHHATIAAGALARALHIHPSSLTGMLRRLEQSGLVERTADPLDARRALLTLTAKGQKLNQKHGGTVEAVVERALRSVSARDLRAAQRVLQAVAAEFDAEGG